MSHGHAASTMSLKVQELRGSATEECAIDELQGSRMLKNDLASKPLESLSSEDRAREGEGSLSGGVMRNEE